MVKYVGRQGLTTLLLADHFSEQVLHLAYIYGCFGDIKPVELWVNPEIFNHMAALSGANARDGETYLYDVKLVKSPSVVLDMYLFYLPVDHATRLIVEAHSGYFSGPDRASRLAATKSATPAQPIVELVISKELYDAHVASHPRPKG